ncbi:hypothetical protein V6N13_080708 [Hibiscus sabdariffa]
MDLNESESGKGGEMEIHHFSHQHPLMFCLASGTAYCFGCDQSVQGPRYGCNESTDAMKIACHTITGTLDATTLKSFANEAAHCFVCDQPLEGPRYG